MKINTIFVNLLLLITLQGSVKVTWIIIHC